MNIFDLKNRGMWRFCRYFAVVLSIIWISASSLASTTPRTQSNTGLPQHQFTVVIDAGHGGHDSGAADNGAFEKEINLNVAKKFASLIKKKMKDVKVVLTRSDDNFISLQERANIANRNKADLFISIHTNSLDKNSPNRTKVSGASVYTLGPQKDENNLQVARRENSVIELESNYHQKYSGFDPNKDESYIIFEMAQKKNLGQSLKLADKIQKELVSTAGRKDRGVKQAGFWVLWATSMPSVLVELDFICNPDEAKFLDSDEGQDKFAEALFNGLDSYIKSGKKAFAESVGNQGESLHNQQAGADLRKETAVESPIADGTEDGVNTLVASAPKSEKDRQHKVSTQTNTRANNYKPRRRRSDSSKALSDSKSFETGSIVLKSETEFLAVKDKEPEQVKEVKPEPSATDKAAKKKKAKKKAEVAKQREEKKPEEKKPAEKKPEIKSRNSNSHTKTFSVKSTSELASTKYKTSSSTPDAKGKKQVAAGKATKEVVAVNVKKEEVSVADHAKQMIYKIKLLESEVEKRPDDPAFCGLQPSGVFKENGKYKYTYGASKSRREIEQKLMDIKSLIPDATIIVSME